MRPGNHLLPTRTVVVTEIDKVKLGVREIDAPRRNVQGEPVRPVDLGGDDRRAVGAVHTYALDPGVLAPVRPEEPTCAWNKSGSGGYFKIILKADASNFTSR